MDEIRAKYLVPSVLAKGRRSAQQVATGGLERRVSGDRSVGRVVVPEVLPQVVVYPWMCRGCGSQMRHGDLCAFCGRRGQRVVRRR